MARLYNFYRQHTKMTERKQKTLPETKVLKSPEDFKEFIENLEDFLKRTENAESVSKNFPLFCGVVETLKDSPFNDFKSIFAQLAQSINAQRLEKVQVETKIKQLEKEEDRLAAAVIIKKEEVKKAEARIAESIKDSENIYQDRLSSLDNLDASLKRKEKSINGKLNQIERTKSEIMMTKEKFAEVSAKNDKDIAANKNYLAVILKEKAVLRKQEEEAVVSTKRLQAEQDKFKRNGENVKKSIEVLQKERAELDSRKKEVVKLVAESRKVIQDAAEQKNSSKLHIMEVAKKEAVLKEKETALKGLVGTIKTVGERLEKRYGISGLANFAEEKQSIIDDSNKVTLMKSALNAIVMQARKKGWSPKEIEVPILTATGGDKYITELL